MDAHIRFRRAVAGLPVMVAAAGCATASPVEPPASTIELRSLPSLTDTRAGLQSAVDEITALLPEATWRSAAPTDTGDCQSPYELSGGERAFLPHRIAEDVPVSEPQWQQIAATAQASAAGIGATGMQVVIDKPGRHDVWFTGPGGLFLKVSYGGNLVVSGHTGCRLAA